MNDGYRAVCGTLKDWIESTKVEADQRSHLEVTQDSDNSRIGGTTIGTMHSGGGPQFAGSTFSGTTFSWGRKE